MKKVDFYWTENDGSQTVVFTLGMDEDGEIKVVGDKHNSTADEILKNGIRGRMSKTFVKEDGLDFLKEMKYVFSGSRFRASDVYDSGNGEQNEKEKS